MFLLMNRTSFDSTAANQMHMGNSRLSCLICLFWLVAKNRKFKGWLLQDEMQTKCQWTSLSFQLFRNYVVRKGCKSLSSPSIQEDAVNNYTTSLLKRCSGILSVLTLTEWFNETKFQTLDINRQEAARLDIKNWQQSSTVARRQNY